MTNPFTLAFGMIPAQFISRPVQTNEIIDNFTAEKPSTPIYMITGVRGSGKTVMLTSISKELSSREDWIVVELNPEGDLLASLVSKLYNIEKIRPLFIKAKINLGYSGTGVSIESNSPEATSDIILDKMLQVLNKQGKRLLVAIDEVTNNEYIKRFSHEFQILLRRDYNINVIMTGLYENIYDLQNEKTLTFLYRAPKIILKPLSMPLISRVYADTLAIDSETAAEMAKLTSGYPFAFQVLGYLYWKMKNAAREELLSEYDHYLSEYVYDKIWHELSYNEEQAIIAISHHEDYVKIQTVREDLSMAPNQFSQCREKLIRKGLVDTSRYGYIKLVLPRFKEYAIAQEAFEEM